MYIYRTIICFLILLSLEGGLTFLMISWLWKDHYKELEKEVVPEERVNYKEELEKELAEHTEERNQQ